MVPTAGHELVADLRPLVTCSGACSSGYKHSAYMPSATPNRPTLYRHVRGASGSACTQPPCHNTATVMASPSALPPAHRQHQLVCPLCDRIVVCEENKHRRPAVAAQRRGERGVDRCSQ